MTDDRLMFAVPEELVESIAERVAGILLERNGDEEAASPYMTIPEAAEYLRCSRQAVDDMLRKHRLRRFKRGDELRSPVLVLRSEVEGLVREPPR